jgi:hypothetical protein
MYDEDPVCEGCWEYRGIAAGKNASTCPACSAEANGPMGRLGRLLWYRCQQCGMEWHRDSPVRSG